MTEEILFLIHALGIQQNLENLKAMRKAKAPIRGYVLTTCFWALSETGFFDELLKNGSVPFDSFARRQKIDPVIFAAVVQYLVRVGILENKNRTLTFSSKGKKFWDETNGVFSIFSAYQPYFKNLGGLLKKELPLGKLKRDDLSVALGFRETGARFTFPIMNKILGELKPKGLIELGCGNLDLSQFIARRHPEMNFLGIDHDDRFLNEARQTIRSHPLDGRFQLLKRDIFKLSPRDFDFSPYDLVTAIDLFHGYFSGGKEKLLDLFSNLRQTFKGKTFFVSEVCLPDENRMKGLSYPHVEHELFHNLTGQKTFRQGELESLLGETGFGIQKSWNVRNLAARVFVQFH